MKLIEILNSIENLIKTDSFIFPLKFFKSDIERATDMIIGHLIAEHGIYIFETRNNQKGYLYPNNYTGATPKVKMELSLDDFNKWFSDMTTSLCIPEKCLSDTLEIHKNAQEIEDNQSLTKLGEVDLTEFKNRIKAKIDKGETVDRKSYLIGFDEFTAELEEDKKTTDDPATFRLINNCIDLLNDRNFTEDRIVTLAKKMFECGYQDAMNDLKSQKHIKRTVEDRAVTSISKGVQTINTNTETSNDNGRLDAQAYLEDYKKERGDFTSDRQYFLMLATRHGGTKDKYIKIIKRYFEAEFKEIQKKYAKKQF